jgi:hypothetical protein
LLTCGQDPQIRHVRWQYHGLYSSGLIAQDVQKSSLLVYAEGAADMRLRHVGIHEKDGNVFFERHAQSEIDRRERLAFRWHRARHHDELTPIELLRTAPRCMGNQRPFDLSVLISERSLLVLRWHQPFVAKRVAVDTNNFVGAMVDDLSFWLRRSCDHRIHDFAHHTGSESRLELGRTPGFSRLA